MMIHVMMTDIMPLHNDHDSVPFVTWPIFMAIRPGSNRDLRLNSICIGLGKVG